MDSTGLAPQGPTYDLAGNLTYDGNYAYAYDAWNRLVRVNNAWRETSGFGTAGVTLGPVQTGAVVDVMKYDGLNRRSVKAVQNTGHLDCTYHYYYDNQWRILEERNGSDGVLKQQVWAPLPTSGGSGYVDELVQVAVNADLINNPTMNWSPPLPGVPPRAYWVMQDANYNVLGLVDATGALKERYEYTPYGQRQVFISAGANDPDCYVGQYISARVPTSTAGVVQPYGLCEFGHQGLLHDEEIGNGEVLENRWRMYHARLGLWPQLDPAGYVDGANRYQYVISNPVHYLDPIGLGFFDCCNDCKRNSRQLVSTSVGLTTVSDQNNRIGPDTLSTILELPEAVRKAWAPIEAATGIPNADALVNAAGDVGNAWATTVIPRQGDVEVFGSGPGNMGANATKGQGPPSTNYSGILQGAAGAALTGMLQNGTIDMGKVLMDKAMNGIDAQYKKAFGVNIFVVVKYKRCEEHSCWKQSTYLGWSNNYNYRHRCMSKNTITTPPGYLVDGAWGVNDIAGINADMPECVRTAIQKALNEP